MPLSRLSWPDDGDCGRDERREEGIGGERQEEGNQWPELGGEIGEGLAAEAAWPERRRRHGAAFTREKKPRRLGLGFGQSFGLN